MSTDNGTTRTEAIHLRLHSDEIEPYRKLADSTNQSVSKVIREALAKESPAAGTKTSDAPRGIAIYHRVYDHEDFADAANKIFTLIRKAAVKSPDAPRILYLDIDGHRNDAGGFDADMYELQKDFLLGFLSRWLSEIVIPLMHVRCPQQHEDVPDTLTIGDASADEDN